MKSPEANGSEFTCSIDRISNVSGRSRLAGQLLIGIGGLVSLVLSVILIDAVIPFTNWSRQVGQFGLLTLLVIALWQIIRVRAFKNNAKQICSMIERDKGLLCNEMCNAYNLADTSGNLNRGVTEQLTMRVIHKGQSVLASLDQNTIIDRKLIRTGLLTISLGVVLWILCFAISPRLFIGGIARWVDPYGDHPPFSLTHISVSIGPETIVSGGHAIIRAKLSGRIPDHAEWVTINEDTGNSQSWPMRRVASDTYERRLLNIKEPLIFHVSAGGGRSNHFQIVPLEINEQVLSNVPGNIKAETVTSTTTGDSEVARLGSREGNEYWSDLASDLKNLIERTNTILNSSAYRLNELYSESDSVSDELEDVINQLDSDIDQYQLAANIFHKRWGTHDSTLSPQFRSVITQSMKELQHSPLATSHKDQDDSKRTHRSTLGHRSGQADNGGIGHHVDSGLLKQWMNSVEQAAKNDATVLQKQLSNIPSQYIDHNRAKIDREFSIHDQAIDPAVGIYEEVAGNHKQVRVDKHDISVQTVPEIYREAASRYLWHITKDQNKYLEEKSIHD